MTSIRSFAIGFTRSAGLLALFILGVAVAPAFAATATWTNTGTDFNLGTNWTGGTGAGGIPGSGDNATFTGAEVTNPNLSAPDTIQGLTFSTAATSGYTLSSSGPSLTLTNVGTAGNSAINAANTSGTNTISANIILGGNAATTATLTQASTGTLAISGNISSTNAINGLSLATGGIYQLSGTNSYTGTTTLGVATLNLNSNSALGTGNLIVNGAASILNNTSGSIKTLANSVTVNQSFSFAGTNDLTFGGGLLVNAGAKTYTVSGGRLTFNGGVNWGAFRTIKTGAGTLVLNGAGSGAGLSTTVGTGVAYVETARIDAGFVEIGNNAAFSTGVVEIRTGGGLSANTPVTLANAFNLSTLNSTFGGTNNMTFNGAFVISNGAGSNVNTLFVTNTGSTLINNSLSLTDATTVDNQTLTVDVASTAGATEIAGAIQNSTVANGSVGSFTKAGAGTLKLSGGSTYTGTTDIQNGTIQLTGSLSSSSLLNLGNGTNSGKLILGGSGGAVNQTVARLASAGTGTTNAIVGGNAAVSTLTVNSTANSTYAGVLGGAGANENNLALTKDGTGALTLSGINTYTGPTSIVGGKLVVNGSVNSSPITVSSGTLDGTGSVGATSIANNPSSIIANGNGSASALTLSSLAFGGAATANIKVGQATPTVAGLNVTGALSTTPINGTVTINASTDTGLWTNGIIDLIKYGSFGGAANNFSLGTVSGLGARQISGLLLSGGNVALQISGDSPKWTGLDSGNWQVGSTGASSNWKLITAGTATDYIDGDVVLFDDSAAGTTTVDINAGNIAPANITFNNSSKNYTITGSGGGITAPGGGGGGLTKNGTGSLNISANLSYNGATTINNGAVTLSGANSYGGGTVFNGGTLNVGNATALGTGALTIGSGVAKTLDNSSGSALPMTGNIAQNWNDDFTFAGTNDLDMGTGAVTLSGTSRTITLNANKLTVGGLNGGTTTALVVNGPGTLAITNSTVGGLSGNGNFVNNASTTGRLTVNQNTDSVFSGTMNNGPAGIFGLTKQGTAKLTLSGVNTYTADTSLVAGNLVLANASALTNSRVNIAGTSTTLTFAIDSDFATPVALGVTSGMAVTIVSDRATPGAAVDRTMNTPSGLGTGQINFTAGANVTSGTGRVTFNQFSLGAGGTGTTIVNPTGVNLSLGNITKSSGASAQTVELSGTTLGNEVFGQISNGSATTSITKTGTGTWALSQDNSYTGTTVISGGTLVLGNGGSSGTLGTGAVTNNGTLAYNRSDTSFVETHAINGSGGVRQIGSGKTTLSAVNSYIGPTVITGGTLAVTGSINNSALTVTSGTLDGTGSVGATTVADLATNTIANGNGGAGVLTLSSLAFGGDATVNTTKAIGITPIAVTNALATTPANGQVTINGSGTWSSGLNNLISFGSFSGAISNFSVGSITGLSSRQTVGSLALNGNNIALNIVGDVLKWTGKDDANWAVGLSGTNKNWKLTSGPATDYLDGDEVQFDDSATGSTVVDLGSFVSPTNTTFNNSTKNYTLNSASGFGIQTNSLTKTGTGSVTINTLNSYTGGTTLNGGTLNIGNSGALGNGSLTIGAGTAKTLNNTSGSPMTMSTVTSQTWNDDFTFTGSNDLDMGTGTVTLSGTSRAVTVTAGRLTVGGLNGGTTTALVVNGAGTLAIGNSTVTGLSGNGNIANNATAAATLTVNMSSNFTYSGVLSDGVGNFLALTKQGDGALTLTNASTYTGNTSIQGGTVVMSNGQALGAVTAANTVRFSNAAPSTSATLDMATNGVGDNVYRIMVGSGALVNIVSNRATPGAGINHALTTGGDSLTDTLGGGTINFVKGANVTSGTASVSFDQLNMSSGIAGSSTVLNPTTAQVTIGTVTKNKGALAQILELSGTNTGNQITGSISNGSATSVSLTKSGTSTWTLTGDSSYTGTTTVNGGTLLVNGNNSGATGAVTVGAGGILGGTGTIGSTVTMQAGSAFTSQFSGGTIDPLDIVGDLDLSAINNLLTVVGTGTSGPWTIINYSGTLTGTFESSPGYTVNYGTGANSAITISAAAGLLGDFNSDGKVDAGDYVKWRKNDGPNAALPNDGGAATQAARYTLWRANFGKPPGSGSGLGGANVPEPATWLLISMAVAGLTAATRRRASR